MNNQVKEQIKDVLHFLENSKDLIYVEIQDKLEHIIYSNKADRNVMYSKEGDPTYAKLHQVICSYGRDANVRKLKEGLKGCL